MGDNGKHLLCIDGIKGICACIIAFVWHYRHFVLFNLAPFSNLLFFSYRYGDNIVELFFVLSGFGMMLGYGERISNHGITFVEYIKRRLKKLYPVFILSTSFVIVFELLIKFKTDEFFIYPNFDLYHLVLNLLLLQNGALETEWSFNSPSWVISILMILYCLFYFICYRSKNIKHIYYVFTCLAVLGSMIILSGYSLPLINILFGRGLAAFSVGVLLHLFYIYKEKINYKLIGYISLFFLLLSYLLIRFGYTVYIGNLKMLIILGLCPMIAISVLSITWLNRFFSFKGFVYLGKSSIAIYLFHFPIQCVFKFFSDYCFQINFYSRIIWILYALVTIILSVIYCMFIAKHYENAFIRLIRYGHK